MNTELSYSIARKIARRFYIPGMDVEDLVQECVLKVFLKAPDEEARPVLNRIMRNHLIDLLRFHKYHFQEVEISEVYVDLSSTIIPIPVSDTRCLHVIIALIENDMSIELAASDLGWSYGSTRRAWRKAQSLIRLDYHTSYFLREATISLAHDMRQSGVLREAVCQK